MSKIKQYVNVHRRSRTKFMSIAEFNKEYDADLPSNKVAEAAFHAALRRQRRMTGIPVRGQIYPLARELGLEDAPAAAPKGTSSKFSMRSRRSKKMKSRRMNCGCNAMDDCSHAVSTRSVRRTTAAAEVPEPAVEEPAAIPDVQEAPVKRMGMRLSKINISRPSRSLNRTNIRPPVPEKPKALNAIDERRKHTAAWPNHHNKQREGSKHPKGRGHMRHSHGNRHKAVPEPAASMETSLEVDAVEDHGTFSIQDAREFYQKVSPEFLDGHDLNDVVSAWNKAPLHILLPQIRAKYGQAPHDQWSLENVKAFYNHYDPEFLRNNEVHSVMNDWAECEPHLVEKGIRGKYGSVPGEPFVVVNWTPSIVEDYYNEVYPAKLQEMTADEIIMDWNRYSVERVMEACKSRYGRAPIPQNFEAAAAAPAAVASTESHIEQYKRALEDSGEHFDATKVLHFVPTNVEFGEFTSHASKLKSSTIRFLIDGVKGPFKMFNGDYKTFKSFNKKDMIAAVNAIKSKKSGDFFIRVEE